METINIKNAAPRIVALPPAAGLRKPLNLLPGENDVPKAVWDSAKDNKAIQIWLKAGILEERQGKAKPLPTKASEAEKARASGRRADDLSEFDLKQIETIVADTDDLALLASWGDDPRDEVQSMVRARLDALNKAKPRGRKRKVR